METNNLRKAAEMALEALEDVVKWYASRDANENLMPCHNQNPEIKLSMESVEALRQALDKPEIDPQALVEMAVLAEREACAKLLDDMAAKDKLSNYYAVAARAIRERGEK